MLVVLFFEGMAPPLSIRHGIRIAPPDRSMAVEEVLTAVGEQVGHDNLLYASRMNKAVVVFLKEERFVSGMIESGVVIVTTALLFLHCRFPLFGSQCRGFSHLYLKNCRKMSCRDLGSLLALLKLLKLRCKDPRLKHVQSLRRHVFMFLALQHRVWRSPSE